MMRLYIDGGEASSFGTSKNIASSSQPVRIGLWSDEWFSGFVDEFKLYSRAFNDSELSALVSTLGPAFHASSRGMVAEGGVPAPLSKLTGSFSLRVLVKSLVDFIAAEMNAEDSLCGSGSRSADSTYRSPPRHSETSVLCDVALASQKGSAH